MPVSPVDVLNRDLPHRSLPALLGFLPIAGLGAASGGYFETAWSWAALGLFWVAGLALVLKTVIRVDWAGALFVAGLALITTWTLVSAIWGVSGPAVREVERTLVYLAGTGAALLVVRQRSYRSLVGGVWAGCAVVALYAVGTRLFAPDPGTLDQVEGYRLSAPLGYWNALGIFAAIGLLLATGLASRARSVPVTALAAASTVPLATTVYFTFGRGPWVALAAGFVAALTIDPRRLQLVLIAIVVAGANTVVLVTASRSEALVRRGSSVAAAESQGLRLALIAGVVSVVLAAGVVALRALERRVSVAPLARAGFAALLILVLVSALTVTFARYGSPLTLAEKGYDQLNQPPPETNDLSQRLFDFSSKGRVEQWRVAWRDVKEHPALGSGAGSYQGYWEQHRPAAGHVRDAHNLYLETLAELGPVGLGLLVATLVVPVLAAWRGRKRGLVPFALAAYVAYLVHAGVDWDWEMPAVTLAALFCGCAILVAARGHGKAITLSPRMRGSLVAATLALSVFAFVGLIGNHALADSRAHVRAGSWSDAETEARTGIRWKPWSSEGWKQLAEAQLGADDLAGARASYKKALEKDPNDWNLWFDYGLLSNGDERRAAIARAQELNPLSPEIAAALEALRQTAQPGREMSR